MLKRTVAAVKQKVVSIFQQATDSSFCCIVDAVLVKLDSVCYTESHDRQLMAVTTDLKVWKPDVLLELYKCVSNTDKAVISCYNKADNYYFQLIARLSKVPNIWLTIVMSKLQCLYAYP